VYLTACGTLSLDQHAIARRKSQAFLEARVTEAVEEAARMGGYGVRLIRAFEKWARKRGAVEIAFGVNSEVELQSLASMAKKLGYRKVGENYVL
jgi:GNAT superfamily N-acetyltransferase